MEEEKLDGLNNINGRQQKMKKRKELICPFCGKAYSEPPAISRKDNSTLIS